MTKKRYAVLALALLLTLPALAVFNEKNLGETLSVLRYELNQEYVKKARFGSRVGARNEAQHHQMIEMMKQCNELSLMLYSQNQDYTFDMTYALKAVSKQYESFNSHKMPYDEIVERLDLEIDRYSRLVESLRRLPPQLSSVPNLPDSLAYHNDSLDVFSHRRQPVKEQRQDMAGMPAGIAGPDGQNPPEDMSEMLDVPEGPVKDAERDSAELARRPFVLDEHGQEDRDSCILYATELLKMFSSMKSEIIADNEHYQEASIRLRESYDYAQNRYKILQKRIFVQGQDNYFKVLSTLPRYTSRAFQDARDKYNGNIVEEGHVHHSEWRGPMVLHFILTILLALLLSTVLSIAGIQIASKKVASMRTPEFRHRRNCITMLISMVVFAVAVMVASIFVKNNFFGAAFQILLVLAWFVAAILLSLLIRLDGTHLKAGLSLYLPMIILGTLVVFFRIVFIPNRIVNLFFPLLLLLSFIWQLHLCMHSSEAKGLDRMLAWISLAVIGAATIGAWAGYVLVAVQAIIWWLFQLAAIETVAALMKALDYMEEKYVRSKIKGYKASAHSEFIRKTWFFDFLRMAVLPVIAVVSLPLCIYMALDVFDLTEICKTIFYRPFLNLHNAEGVDMLHLSLYKIVLVAALFFVFKYFNYLFKALYRDYRYTSIRKQSGKTHVQANEVNLTLANNVISILLWGTYAIVIIVLTKLPMGALSIVAAGLATGIGLAMKDILNNFIYGIQLMSGRLRVGDWVECDGVRGKVTSISYQSTQLETTDGAVMSFLNEALFNKNFKNLTRNNSYELVKIVVGVSYGTDVEKVREVLEEALKGAFVKDAYGRDIIDPKRSMTVAFEGFGDSSVDVAVKQYVLVSEHYNYVAKAKEIIYNTLNGNGIEIPFPQRDIHIR